MSLARNWRDATHGGMSKADLRHLALNVSVVAAVAFGHKTWQHQVCLRGSHG
jgi:hypothetical protein